MNGARYSQNTAMIPTRRALFPAGVAVLLLSAASLPAFGQTAENVAVVINEASPDSQRVGDHYIRSRGIAPTNVVRIRTAADETITRAAYMATIEAPISSALSRASLHDRILYIVLTKGIPLRIAGTQGMNGTVASVDSELTLLYRGMTGRDVPVGGRIPNPYYLGNGTIASAQRFSHRRHDIYLVTRLDAFTVDEAIAMIDRGRTSSGDGRFVLDQRHGPGSLTGNAWLSTAGRRLGELGFTDRVVLEMTTAPARNVDNVMGYYSWGSNDAQNRDRRTGMRFVPGAIAATLAGSDARTFREPPADWMPTVDWKDQSTWFGGSPQSLIGDFIRDGVTGVAGQVAEAYLQSAVKPEILFPAYVSGFNLAEAFYLALPHLSWQTVIVGDPLCAPFQRSVLTGSEIEDPIDPDTELPGIFSRQRREQLQRTHKDAPSKALALSVLAEARLTRGDTAGARAALEDAAAMADTPAHVHLHLALLDEQAGDHARAREKYRQVLQLDPRNLVALNNLAYSLAVHEKAPAAAKPFAQQAVQLAPIDPNIVDTLAWIEHLAGNDVTAARLYLRALRGGSAPAGMLVHAAIVFAAIGEVKTASAQLNEAIRIAPELENDEGVRRLRKQLQAPKQ